MKKISFLVLFFCAVFVSCTIAPKDVSTSNLPTSNEVAVPEFQNTYVNDYGDLLSQGEVKPINRALRVYQDSTSTQIVVLTLASFDDQTNGPLFDYSKKVFSTWGIGQKDKNNGVLLVIVKNLASKNAPGLRIVTGYGIEGALPDITCKKIVESIRPLINEGKYEQGINLAISKMQAEIKSEFMTAKTDEKKEPWTNQEIFLLVFFIVIGIVAVYFLIRALSSDSDDDSYIGSDYSGNSNSNRGYSSRRDDTPYIASTLISSSDDSNSRWDSGGSDYSSSDSGGSDSSCDCGGGDSGGGGGGD